jgi:signal transduction histidine kinase
MVQAVEADGGAAPVGSHPQAVRLPLVGATPLARAIRAMVIATITVDLVYLAALLLPGDPASLLIDVWLSIVAQWLPVVVFWLVAVRTRFTRWDVILAAAGLTCNAAGDTYFALAMDSSGNLPSPSLADLGYLLCYPLVMAGVVVLVVRHSRMSVNSVVLDGALASLGTAAVLGVVLGPVFADATGGTTPVDGIIAALYPLFDLVVITAVVGISASPVLRIGPRWQFLVLGLLLFTGADIAYALLVLDDAYVAGTPLDAAWAAGVASGALWVAGVDSSRLAPPAAVSSARMLPVPALAVLAGLGVLLVATRTPVPAFALVLAAATVALSAVPVMFRHAALARMLEGQERAVRRLTELDKSKSDMIGTVSHEMRTPLASILGYLELVIDDEEESVPESAKRLLRVADRNARRLNSLVGNMLMMTQLESGGAPPVVAPVRIGRVLGEAVESLRLFADSKEVGLTLVCPETVTVEGDESQLERVFTNLIENAVKFTEARGTVCVEVTPGILRNGRPGILVAVSDTGMGIPPEELSQLFDRFFRATNAQDQVVPGTGLGLAIVRGIVHAHGGDVSADSVLGEGSTFRVTLPVRRSDGVGA